MAEEVAFEITPLPSTPKPPDLGKGSEFRGKNENGLYAKISQSQSGYFYLFIPYNYRELMLGLTFCSLL